MVVVFPAAAWVNVSWYYQPQTKHLIIGSSMTRQRHGAKCTTYKSTDRSLYIYMI